MVIFAQFDQSQYGNLQDQGDNLRPWNSHQVAIRKQAECSYNCSQLTLGQSTFHQVLAAQIKQMDTQLATLEGCPECPRTSKVKPHAWKTIIQRHNEPNVEKEVQVLTNVVTFVQQEKPKQQGEISKSCVVDLIQLVDE